MISIICSLRNVNSLAKQIESIEVQSVLPDEVIYVIDRFTFDYSFKSDVLNIKFIESNLRDQDRFMAGHCRNLAIAESSGDIVIMIDEDSILCPNLVEAHVNKLLDKHVSIGRRKYNSNHYDFRDDHNFWNNSDVTARGGFTCNLATTREVINKVSKLNKELGYDPGPFCSIYNGNWGDEDIMFSYMAKCLGYKLYTLEDKFYITCNDEQNKADKLVQDKVLWLYDQSKSGMYNINSSKSKYLKNILDRKYIK